MIEDIQNQAPSRESVKFTERHQRLFWARVARGGPDDCWNWIGANGPCGYGCSITAFGMNWRPHRMAYILSVGQIPKGDGFHGTCVLHKCDNRKCCNPSHLFLGTQTENMHDMIRKGRRVVAVGDRNGSRAKRERLPFGEAHWKSKLTNRQALEIRAMFSFGKVPYAERKKLALLYGLNVSSINRLIAGKNWTMV